MSNDNTRKDRVGVVGAGRMGIAMVKHLVKHGFPVVVCDLDQMRLDQSKAAGATTARTPAELGKQTNFVILGVGYDDEVNQVVLGQNGLMETLLRGSIVAVSSTAKPDTVKALDERTRQKGVDVLDAPIARGRFAADAGTLLAFFGGKPE